tara:strand:+ start:6542 stop:6979 length:438 start_codon:yes stop_codon:yes gene_type:complete
MSKGKTNGVETIDGKGVVDEKAEMRKNAIEECGRFLDLIRPTLSDLEADRDRISNAIMVVHESNMTWLERLAGVLDIDVRRGVFANHMGLYWADVDGNILMDDDPDFPTPAHEIIRADDLLKLTTTREGIAAIAKGEMSPEGETQ